MVGGMARPFNCSRRQGARDLKLDWIRLKFEDSGLPVQHEVACRIVPAHHAQDIDLIKPLPRVGNVRTHKARLHMSSFVGCQKG